jgi:subfamily B ATP-binding cassette protein MsbA
MAGTEAEPGIRPRPKPGIRRAALRDLMRLLAIIGKPKWATPVLIVLGLASSFAETIGITLILLFLYAATGHAGNSGSGMLGHFVGLAAKHFGSTAKLAWLILALIVARGVLASSYNRISTNIGAALSERARNAVHQQYLNVSYGFIQGHTQAHLMEVLAAETWEVAGAYGSFTRVIINGCSITVFALFLALVSWKITAVAFIGSAAISAVSKLFTGRARALGLRVKQTHEFMGVQMLMTIQGMRTIRAYGQEAPHQGRFCYTSAEAKELTNALARLSAWIGPITEVGYLGILCVIIAGSGWWHTSFPVTLAAVALLYRLQPHTRELEDHMMHLAQIQPQLQSVRAMLESGDKQYAPAGHVPFKAVRERIVFRNVSFRYSPDSAEALSDISFEIPAGVTTALIGASGAGKTTIVNLLLRLYEPDAGKIFVDGVAMNDLRREDWVGQLGLAGQDVDLVEGTVMDNIRMGDRYSAPAQAIAAARAAGVAAFIEHLPGSYDTWVGQEGLRFSGGQRQRIGLARAILRNSYLLILDEAMSALDRALEDRVKHEIEAQRVARTMLIVTHRLETVRHVQHVVWIEDGRLRAQGPPAAVLTEAMQVLAAPGPDPAAI